MRATRLYFADAAATGGYAQSLLGWEQLEALSKDMRNMIEKVNHSLLLIVIAYIQRRRAAFQMEPE